MNKIVLYSVIGLIVIIGLMGGVWAMSRGNKQPRRQTGLDTPSVPGTPLPEDSEVSSNNAKSGQQTSSAITWKLGSNGYESMGGTPPACPNPFVFNLPADISKATAVLYPGQTRGGDYKPHGGLRFDNSKNSDISVSVPYTAQVVNGTRFLVDGELQYSFDFIADCGVKYRLGHLLVLSPKFQALADTFPEAKEGDSRITPINPPVEVKAGEVIATSVGVTKGGVNTFFDWGVYDLRTKNEVSKDAAWAAKHTNDKEHAPHAVCWFDWLSASDEATIRSLPAGDPQSGKTSDYCK